MTDETSPPAPHANQPEDTPALRQLYADFKDNHLNPLWTQTANLMPPHPRPEAVAHVWEWGALYDMAVRSGDLVPVGRGGERRAIGLANPGLGGAPISLQRFGQPCNILAPVKMRQSIDMRKTPFAL